MQPKIGLVLGGGGSRGIAHIGVLKVLHEHQIPIDLIVGTSMGAIIGTFYALGTQPDDMAKHIHTIGGGNVFLKNMFSAKARQARIRADIVEWLQDKTFEEADIPLTLMAVDVHKGEEVPLQTGKLLPAVLASAAVPAVFPPVEIDGRELVDGGVIDSLATHMAYKHGADIVIAVDIYPPLEQDNSWHDPLSDVMGIASPLSLFSINAAPSMVASVWRSVRITTWYLHEQRLQHHPAHVLIRPEVEMYGSLDFRDVDGPLQAGIDATKALLPEIQRLVTETMPQNDISE